MIKLTAQLGSNPLRYHNPQRCKVSGKYLLSSGESGQIVCWKLPEVQPLYQTICSTLADTDGLIDFIITPLRLITNQSISEKIVTAHNDDRIRIITIQDGLCKNVSQHALLPQKIFGLVENENESRFLMCFGEKTIYIIDSWSLKVVDTLQPQMDSFSILKKGRINKNLELELMDRQSKCYRINLAPLFQEAHLDVGSWVSNCSKVTRELLASIEKIKSQPATISYRKIVEPDITQSLSMINEKLLQIRQQNVWLDIMQTNHRNLNIVKYMCSLQDEEPVVSNCLFIKNSKLWYFFGTNKGRVIGFPCIVKEKEEFIVSNPIDEILAPVAYLSFLDNILIVSWENGMFNIYTTDNLDYSIQTALQQQRRKETNIPHGLCFVDFNQNKIFSEKLSSSIKYRLEIYSISRGKLGTQLLAFQLANNQVLVIETGYRKLSHYRGVPDGSRIYAVLEMEDYYGIVHSNGIDVYSADRFERTIQYDKWVWSDYNLCDEFKCKQDYHNIFSKIPHGQYHDLSEVNAIQMLQYNQRFYTKKLDYYSPTLDLLYETFGPLDSEQMSNEVYPYLHFIQKIYSERTIHSFCEENFSSVIRLKHNNIRRQKLTNTTYLYSCNLNKLLQRFNRNNREVPTNEFESNFAIFSLLFWDEDPGLHLSELYNNCQLKFILKRRYTEQGIGRSFTVYFSNDYKNVLSSELLTYSSISTISLLQVCSHKDIGMADAIVNTLQYYTARGPEDQVKVDVETLSRMSVSDNSQIVKACITILMSTAMKQVVPLHPTFEYFILNLKNIEQKKNRVLTETETVWFVYLGLGFIYSNQLYDKDQVKFLIERLIETIDVKNFEVRPDLIQIVLRVFNEGIKKWKTLITHAMTMKIYVELFRIFFYYDAVANIQPDDKKFNFCFENFPDEERKKMKAEIIKTIRHLSRQFNNQFLQVIRVEAVNQKPHSAYPASVIEILRQYIKNEKPQTNLVFYVELLLQCLSPMTPQLRKHVQKNVLAALQIMCSYQNISFNHPSQKLSLRTDSNIYIYCLRTSTRWRTISLKDERPTQNSVIEMSPQGTYIALLGQKLRIWRLNSGFWSGVLGAFSQGWTFDATGVSVHWDEKEEYITVINENPSENKCFKL